MSTTNIQASRILSSHVNGDVKPNTGILKPVVKKRTAVPTTRAALGTIGNKVQNGRSTQFSRPTKPVVSAKVNTNLSKPLATKSRAKVNASVRLTTKPQENAVIKKKQSEIMLKDKTNKKTVIRTQKENPTKEEVTISSPVKDHCYEKMVLGTPNKCVSEDVLPGNVFENSRKPGVEDIDAKDSANPQLCAEFVNDIYQYMLYLETIQAIKPHYLKNSSLKSKMRSILVDWLIQVHHRFQLLQETLYLTIAILDRFLQVNQVPRAKLQLAGVTAMLIASKYEEMYAPEVSDFEYITDKAFTTSQILTMEILMLKTLDFNLGRPLPLHFLRRDSKAAQVDAEHHNLAKYLLELSLVDYDMCHVPPSKVAAAALYLSMQVIKKIEWNDTCEHYSRYSASDLRPVVHHLAKNLASASTNTYQLAIYAKYGSSKFMRISKSEKVQSDTVKNLANAAGEYQL
jgi:cyclin B